MKYVIVFLVLGGILLCAGCADQQPPEPTPTPTESPTLSPTITPTPTQSPVSTTPSLTPTPTAPMETPWMPDGIIQAREYEGNMDLAGGRYQVYWKIDQEMLYLALRGEVPGWVAIGFEPTSAMKDADILMGRVENGETVVDDMYSTGSFGPHPPDENLGGTFDILEWGGSEENDITIVEFSRKMNTGDAYDAAFVPGQTITIIYALANTDIPSIQHNVVRGTASLTLT